MHWPAVRKTTDTWQARMKSVKYEKVNAIEGIDDSINELQETIQEIVVIFTFNQA